MSSPEGPVEGWFLPGKGVSTRQPGPVVLVAHGNGELIDHLAHQAQAYTELGCSVLLVEYRYMNVPDLPPVSVSNPSTEVSGQEE